MVFLMMVLMAILIAMPMVTHAESICLDNSTLLTNITYDGVYHNYTEPCQNGCDNTTMSCAPAVYEANLITFGVIILIIIGIAMLYKWSRR